MAALWKLGAPYGADKVEIVTSDGGQAVATVWVKRGVPDRETGREVFVDDLAGIGRARLIAAAPDLLEAARFYFQHYCLDEADDVEHCIDGERQHRAAIALRDAIAKAEGRS